MASHNPYTLYVNQKLAFARFQLAAARENLLFDDVQHRLATHACLDAALHQLYEALLHFVREVAVQMDVALDYSAHDVRSLVEQHRSVPEFSEMANLLAARSWLSQLLEAHRNYDFIISQFVDAANKNTDDRAGGGAGTRAGVIPAIQVTPDLPLDLIESWSHSLQSLVDRQRDNLIES